MNFIFILQIQLICKRKQGDEGYKHSIIIFISHQLS